VLGVGCHAGKLASMKTSPIHAPDDDDDDDDDEYTHL
jgi:hypothetical protein